MNLQRQKQKKIVVDQPISLPEFEDPPSPVIKRNPSSHKVYSPIITTSDIREIEISSSDISLVNYPATRIQLVT